MAKFPQFPTPGGPLDISISGLQQDFDLGLGLANWVGLFAVGSGTVITGTDAASILVNPENSFAVSGEGGLVLRLARFEDSGTQIAARLSGGLGTGRTMSVYDLVSALLANPEGTFDRVLRGKAVQYVLSPRTTRTFAGSLLAAQAISRLLSFQASITGRRTSTTDSPFDQATKARLDKTTRDTQVDASLAVTVDGAPSGVPAALMLEYDFVIDKTDEAGDETNTMHLVGVGVYYTGRRNLQFGVGGVARVAMRPVEGVDESGASAKSGTPSWFGGQFILRYTG